MEQDKKLDPVVSGTVRKEKRSIGQRMGDAFISENSGDVKSYILFDVIVPAIKDMIADAIKGGVDRMMYGSRVPNGRGRGSSNVVNYTKYSRPVTVNNRMERTSGYERYNADNPLLETRQDAETVLNRMLDILEEYDSVSIADMNELLGESSTYTDNNWGWYDLSHAYVSHVRDGFLLKLPRPVSLK